MSPAKRAQIIGCLVEGNSIRATVQMTGTAKNTITKLLADLGEACAEYQDGAFQSLPCTFTAICADTKLVPSCCRCRPDSN